MILDISSALMSIVYSGGPCPPVSLRGDPFAPLRCLLRGPLPPGLASRGPLRPAPLFTPGAPAPRSRFVGPHRPTPLVTWGAALYVLQEAVLELLQLARHAGIVNDAANFRHEAADD